ncbi:hypothetical protein KFK14_12870 [Sphingobium phenoxybenzoativorans]|uniref:Uncharacterized protein n=1 Tax=Sphingobium phenoxybenzoativorans TaxID=1592790 RepID=A0A975K444_9SPHN|nr:hypothetical protein [Sphingobium phenoxybenzoativorans]QUT04039.1 hypothetical protein KFK14_12870 [Sphingobium phenoxybenzoativorans]
MTTDTKPLTGYAGLPMSDADMTMFYEASKRDDAPPLVGSEVRQLIGELRYHRLAAASREDDEEDIYQIGKREGFEEAIQMVDQRTGGDGEYFASTIPGRGCPDWQTMLASILDRFEARAALAASPVGEVSEYG